MNNSAHPHPTTHTHTDETFHVCHPHISRCHTRRLCGDHVKRGGNQIRCVHGCTAHAHCATRGGNSEKLGYTRTDRGAHNSAKHSERTVPWYLWVMPMPEAITFLYRNNSYRSTCRHCPQSRHAAPRCAASITCGTRMHTCEKPQVVEGHVPCRRPRP